MDFGFLHHALDLVLLERGRSGDGHLVLLARAAILRAYLEDAVGVDVEADLDLRHAARCGWNAVQREGAENAVVARHRTLALQHNDFDRWLAVRRRREHLVLGGR